MAKRELASILDWKDDKAPAKFWHTTTSQPQPGETRNQSRPSSAISPSSRGQASPPSATEQKSSQTQNRHGTQQTPLRSRNTKIREPRSRGGSQSRSSGMSSQRRATGRNGRGPSDNGVDKGAMMEEIKNSIAVIQDEERRAKHLREKILTLETKMKSRKDNGLGESLSNWDELQAMYREQVKIADAQSARVKDESLITRIELLAAIQHAEQEEPLPSARNSSSRTSGLDSMDGPSDSPIPSPAENRVRKVGGSRTGSQPPSMSEASDRAGRPKIVYHLKEEVAFKRKVPGGKPEDQDWIQGEVVRIIGDGKSRRYDVKDIDPEAAANGNAVSKSSASQMVPIPPEGAVLGEYEVGKQVLALYPQATTFYRAEVKATIDGGARVLVLFDEEIVEKPIARRFVLDHRG
ncbi:unnamed protein product [Diplocarpon coronariae]|uniref:SGF29 C-terminal domain-containing protein n=1 Tax=Diplocarpon coronariae TaxID=2795749 RepID=A0A218Z056_9HELO|nr:hypothetical protein JHW43_003847 [Diplocarpon mali]OWP01318.1 hypothetical protein B2J93_7302 [Marssonina coronariae]